MRENKRKSEDPRFAPRLGHLFKSQSMVFHQLLIAPDDWLLRLPKPEKFIIKSHTTFFLRQVLPSNALLTIDGA